MKQTQDDGELRRRLGVLEKARADWRSPKSDEAVALRCVQAAWCNAAIEGNPLDWPSAQRLALGQMRTVSRHAREMLNCLAAAEFMEEAPRDWNLSLVRHLHALVMDGLAGAPGRLREREVKIVKESGEDAGKAVFHPPHPARVGELLEDLLADCGASGEDPFLMAGRFHYEFQSIHPFEDGNGRVGRLLSTHLARRSWAAGGFHLEPAIRRWGSAYYLALRAVRVDYEEEGERGLDPWLFPFLDMAAEALLRPVPFEETL